VTDQPAAAAPAPAPPAAAPAPPAAPAPAPAAGGLSAAEEAQLGALLGKQAAAAADEGAVRMKVEGGHASLSYGGVTVGTEFTTVPAALAAPFLEAAADAGVTITQES
jgi:2-oxoglutarate dehydrogenase E2 component (dihydrolipoamide succinyltransferase)